MATKTTKSEIQQSVEARLMLWMKPGADTPSKDELGVVDRALDYLKIITKLDEASFGDELEELERKTKRGRNDD